VELDHTRVSVARQAINDSGLSHLITVEQGDARNFDASRATVITAYLYPTLLAELSSKLRSVRVAASPFHQVEGLNMVQHGDVWLYRRGGA
jgi:predicted RNA methylase